MKAIVHRTYGSPDVLKVEEVETPVAGDDEVLINVRAASINPIDRVYRGVPYLVRIITGLRKPKNIRVGHDLAGRVEAVGANVTQFKPGDEVFGVSRGTLAEFVCASESRLAMKPGNVTFEQATCAGVAALTALQGLRDKGRIRAGQRVLVNGASGGVGTFAVQIAKSFGADVTGVCSTTNVELVRSLGADHVIDYTREDFTAGTRRYDLIFDCAVSHSLSAYRRVLNPKGIFVIAGSPKVSSSLALALKGLALSWFMSQKFVLFVARLRKEDLTALGELMAAGKLTPVIDRRHTLSEVPEAFRYLDEGHARGKIVIETT
jgi:NADPH:quinone reductase-like Zn-dependent oxidoreductase